MSRIMVGQKQPFDSSRGRELRDIGVSAVSPVLLCRIFFGRVLGIVNHHVGALHKQSMPPVTIVENRFQLAGLGIRMP